MKILAALALALVVTTLRTPAAARAGSDGPPVADVQKAIDTGAAWLRARFASGFRDETFHDEVELIVLALAHAGANLSDKVYAKAIETLEHVEPRWTYRTSLLAMALAEVNPRLYRRKIAHCAQWLVDTQLKEGEWGYPGTAAGEGHIAGGLKVQPPPEPEPDPTPAPAPAPGMGAGTAPGMSAGTKPAAKGSDRISIVRQSPVYDGAGPKGDFSNTQFAILGLRACRDAGVDVPVDVWKAAVGYLRKYQRPDGGWGYVTSGEQDESSYASLTCAGLCSAMISLTVSGVKDAKSDAMVQRAIGWLKKNPDLTTNVNMDKSSIINTSAWQYYHLYSLERAGRVLGTADVGGKPWYGPGATWLLSTQQGDGHWEDTHNMADPPSYMNTADTCFAILFLTRATRPLTGGN